MSIKGVFSGYNIKQLALCLLFALLCNFTSAQNNPYKINDALYPRLVQIQKNVNKDIVLSMCDSLFMQAVKQQDVKAQCLALVYRCTHFYDKLNTKQVSVEVKRSLDFIGKTKYLNYYYFVWRMQVLTLINTNTNQALSEIFKMKADAELRKSNYGFIECYKSLSILCIHRLCLGPGVFYLKKAIELDKNRTNKYNNYSILSEAYEFMEDYENAEECARMAVMMLPSNSPLLSVQLSNLYYFLYLNGKYDEMKSIEKGALDDSKTSNSLVNIHRFLKARVVKCLLNNEKEKAFRLTDSLSDNFRKTKLREIIAKTDGNYKDAFLYAKKFHNQFFSLKNKDSISSFFIFGVNVDNYRLEQEKKRLLIQSVQDQLSKVKINHELLQIEGRHKQLEISSRQLKIEKQRIELDRNAALIRTKEVSLLIANEDIKNEEIRTKYAVITASAVSLMSCFCLFLLIREHRLKEKIAVEAEKAKAADVMKTIFVQKASAELGKPLLAILNSSKAIVDNKNGDSNERVKQIHNNSELLEGLINDILRESINEGKK